MRLTDTVDNINDNSNFSLEYRFTSYVKKGMTSPSIQGKNTLKGSATGVKIAERYYVLLKRLSFETDQDMRQIIDKALLEYFLKNASELAPHVESILDDEDKGRYSTSSYISTHR